MKNNRKTWLLAIKLCSVVLLCLVSLGSNASVPKVVVSIGPIHSLISQLMLGVGEPALLIQGGQSPHTYQLNPSALKQMAKADLVVRIGPDFEIALDKPITSMVRTAQVVNLIELPQIQLLQNRNTGLWENEESHAHENEGHFAETKDDHGVFDPHLWLSVDNAIVIVNELASRLSQLDPENAQRYRDNAQLALDDIDQLRKALEQQLTPIRATPYMVFHDAFHYFEHQFGLNAVGAVTLSPEKMPGAKTLLDIQQHIESRKVRCLFHEPQYQPKLVKRIAEATAVRAAELDPVGAALTPGPDLWPRLMTNISEGLLSCVRPLSE